MKEENISFTPTSIDNGVYAFRFKGKNALKTMLYVFETIVTPTICNKEYTPALSDEEGGIEVSLHIDNLNRNYMIIYQDLLD